MWVQEASSRRRRKGSNLARPDIRFGRRLEQQPSQRPRREKIRILREGDRGKSVLEACRAHNISGVSFYRWKRQFGQIDLNEARKLKELERENSELKKMLTEALRKNRVLEAVAWKKGRPGAPQTSGPRHRQTW